MAGAREHARDLAHELKEKLGIPECIGGVHHDWPCDRLTATIAAVIVQVDGNKPRVKCALCKRHVLVVNGAMRAHGFSFGERDRCEGSGRRV